MFKISALSTLLHRNWGILLIWSTTDSSAIHTEYLQVIMVLKILGSFVKIFIIPCFNKIQGNKQEIPPSHISSIWYKGQAKQHKRPHPMLTGFVFTRIVSTFQLFSWIFLIIIQLLCERLTFVSVYFAAVCYKRHFFWPAHVFVSN